MADDADAWNLSHDNAIADVIESDIDRNLHRLLSTPFPTHEAPYVINVFRSQLPPDVFCRVIDVLRSIQGRGLHERECETHACAVARLVFPFPSPYHAFVSYMQAAGWKQTTQDTTLSYSGS